MDRLLSLSEARGPREDVRRVIVDIAEEPVTRELFRPVLRRMDVHVRGLTVVDRRRGEEHIGGVRAHVGDGGFGLARRNMLSDLDRHDQVVVVAKISRDGADAAERPDRFAHVIDGEGREIDAEGVHAARAQRLDQEAERAARVEHAPRRHVGHDAIRDATEKTQPLVVADVRLPTAVPVVEPIEVVRINGGPGDPIEVV